MWNCEKMEELLWRRCYGSVGAAGACVGCCTAVGTSVGSCEGSIDVRVDFKDEVISP